MTIRLFLLTAALLAAATARTVERGFSIPQVDLTKEEKFFATVDQRPGIYLGQVSTVLFKDGKTILAAYPEGHGHGRLVLNRSTNAGDTWRPVDIPAQEIPETPVLYRLDLPGGKERVLLTTCRPRDGVLEWMWSDDRGSTWSPRREWKLEGTKGAIVALASLWPTPGDGPPHWRGVFHDFSFDNWTVDLALDAEGGCVFNNLRRIDFATPAGRETARRAGLCEAGLVARPDGKRIALLFRAEKRTTNAMVSFSDDHGVSWTDPRELPGSLTGHRHESVNLPDGRTIVFMRDFSPLHTGNPAHGDWVAWVGKFSDLENGGEGQYRIRLRKNFGSSMNGTIGDCGYSGVELLPGGTIFAATYGHWTHDAANKAPSADPDGRGEKPFVVRVKFDPREIDRLAGKK